jgi:hypothetical protein
MSAGNGAFNLYSKTWIASITNGTSNTFLFGEAAWGRFSARKDSEQQKWQSWTSARDVSPSSDSEPAGLLRLAL